MTPEELGRHVGEHFKAIVGAALRGKQPATFDEQAPDEISLLEKCVTMALDLEPAKFSEELFYRWIAPAGSALAQICLHAGMTSFEPLKATKEDFEERPCVTVSVCGWSGPSYSDLAEAVIAETGESLNERA